MPITASVDIITWEFNVRDGNCVGDGDGDGDGDDGGGDGGDVFKVGIGKPL
jgi:hypothetical protein